MWLSVLGLGVADRFAWFGRVVRRGLIGRVSLSWGGNVTDVSRDLRGYDLVGYDAPMM